MSIGTVLCYFFNNREAGGYSQNKMFIIARKGISKILIRFSDMYFRKLLKMVIVLTEIYIFNISISRSCISL